MSRVAKMPIAVPAGADVAISAQAITVKGPLGVLTQVLNGQVKVENKEGTLNFVPADDSREANASPARCAPWSTTWSPASPRVSRKS